MSSLLRTTLPARTAWPPPDPGSDTADAGSLAGDEAPPPLLVWAGGPDPLRVLVADHAAAVGARLVEPDPRVLVPRGVIGTLSALGRRAGRAATEGIPLLAVSAEPVIPESDWRLAVRLGVRSLARLPEESAPFLELLGPLVRAPLGALVIGVVGGCGGAGASSLAARLAGASARAGHRTTLLDADPLGGGLDLLVEAPGEGGARWEDVGILGEGDGRTLCDGLPVVDDVRLLTARAAGPPTVEQADGALRALSPLGGSIVVDLSPASVAPLLPRLTRLIVLCPATDHAVRACARRLLAWGTTAGAVGLVVRRGGPLRPREVASDLDLDLLGDFREGSAGLVPLLDVRRRGADRLCDRLIRGFTSAAETAEQRAVLR